MSESFFTTDSVSNAARRWGLPPPRRATVSAPDDLVARRAAAGGILRPVAVPGIAVANVQYGGVPCVVCSPPDPDGVVIYFHGGGYRMGTAPLFAGFAARLAQAARARVVVVDYRLAPENPFPAALHDAVGVYQQLLAEGDTAPIAVGDSAGGGLAAALVKACVDAGVATPRGLVTLSGWFDLRCTAASYQSRSATDQLFSLDSARQAAELYLQGHDPSDPLASPVLADASAFPPALLFASNDEVLLGDTVSMAAVLAQAGVATAASFVPGLPHTWPTVLPDHPESAIAVDAIARFVHHLSREGA